MSSSNQMCRKRRRPTLFVSEGGTANLSTFFANARFCRCRDCSDFRARSRDQSGWARRSCRHARGRRCDRLVAREGQAVGGQRPTIGRKGWAERGEIPLSALASRLDVLVHVEQVVGVVFPLGLDQPLVVLAEVGRSAALVVVGGEVDVAALL